MTQQLAIDASLCVSLVCQVYLVPDSVSTFVSVKPLETVKDLLGQIPAIFVATIKLCFDMTSEPLQVCLC